MNCTQPQDYPQHIPITVSLALGSSSPSSSYRLTLQNSAMQFTSTSGATPSSSIPVVLYSSNSISSTGRKRQRTVISASLQGCQVPAAASNVDIDDDLVESAVSETPHVDADVDDNDVSGLSSFFLDDPPYDYRELLSQMLKVHIPLLHHIPVGARPSFLARFTQVIMNLVSRPTEYTLF